MSTLRTITWNVHGLSKKLNDHDFTSILLEYDIIGLTETWTSTRSNINKLHGYDKFHHYRHKGKKRGRPSGGILIYFKKALKPGISKIPQTHEDLLWIKLDKHFFGLKRHLYYCVVYVKPNSDKLANSAL